MSVRLVIDMNLPPAWAVEFVNHGIAADHWATVGDIRANDFEIMEWARRHQAVVLTNDLDFTTILALTHAIGPSVILLRSQKLLRHSLHALVVESVRRYQSDLEKGALIVIEASRSVVRILPL